MQMISNVGLPANRAQPVLNLSKKLPITGIHTCKRRHVTARRGGRPTAEPETRRDPEEHRRVSTNPYGFALPLVDEAHARPIASAGRLSPRGALGMGWLVFPDALLQGDHLQMKNLHSIKVRLFFVIEHANLDIDVIALVDQRE
jgi:hypothetical protein